MKTVIGFTGPEAFGELANRLDDPDVDGVDLQVGQTATGELKIALEDRGFTVVLTVNETVAAADAVCRLASECPERRTSGLAMLAEALFMALEHVGCRGTVH